MFAKTCAAYALGMCENNLVLLNKHTEGKVLAVDSAAEFTGFAQQEAHAILWVTLPAWLKLSNEDRCNLAGVSKVLVLSSDADMNSLDQFNNLGFSAILAEPLDPGKVRKALGKALEERNIYQDVYRMAREIMLERELLERKNTNLKFLVNFLSNTSGLLLPDEILTVAAKSLEELLPVKKLAAFLWLNANDIWQGEEFTPCMFIPAMENTPDWARCEMALIDAARNICHENYGNYESYSLQTCGCAHENSENNPELSIALPLRIKEQAVGVAVITLTEDFPLGRDNLEVLESAMSHLALALRSTWLYKQVKNRSERDALTSLYNRCFFDKRLQHEIRRHERYGHELGLLIIDIDYFKSVNDDFGHMIGDDVLREVGQLLCEELRYADCVARYGGEEFIALLPYTSDEQSWRLAERLRHRVENHNFCCGHLGRKVTVSIGVSGFRPKMGINACQLVNQADIALYRAKNQGRNCSVLEQILPAVEIASASRSAITC